jgi:hypothetical protein
MQKLNELKNFVKNNNLEFNNGSGGDINILALTGYAQYVDATLEECIKVVNNPSVNDEIERVYNYAKTHNYKKYWSTQQAKDNYKF